MESERTKKMYKVEVVFTSEDRILDRKEYGFDSREKGDFFQRTITDPDADSETMRKAFMVLSALESSRKETTEEVNIEFGSREYHKITAHVSTQSQRDFYFQEFFLDSIEAARAFSRGVESAAGVSYLIAYISGIKENIERVVGPVLHSEEEIAMRRKGYSDVDIEVHKIAFLRGAEAVGEWNKFEGSSEFIGVNLDPPELVVLSETSEFIIGGITLEFDELFIW